ncbi:MAG: ribosome biogenesis GTPase Der [Deltaproteobacteria bacterium]|nr:ribosome biogenesis GTPase Der [Deltaproteobacteria bacterium]
MAKRIPLVTIVGRANVGKSTLFNALIGQRRAVVDDASGVTRDRNYALVRKEAATFTLVDTAGLFAEAGESAGAKEISRLEENVKTQTEIAIDESDLVLVLFDGTHGVHPRDAEVVQILRQSKKPVVWVVNKCEKPSTELAASELYSLGIEELHFISAAHRKGIKELITAIGEKLSEQENKESDEEPQKEPQAEPIKIAVLGKPNVGKSTVINKLIGQERIVTSDVAGTTRDNIDVPLVVDGQDYLLIDTAGLRRKAKVKSVSVERYSNLRSLKALARCDVAVLLLDATQGLPADQDIKIASLIHERGRGLVIAVNKWDLIEKDHKTAKAFKDAIHAAFKGMRYAPILFISGLTGRRCLSVVKKAKFVYQSSKERIKTADINKLLADAMHVNPPPVVRGEPVKLFFSTQVDVSPPTFVLFFNHPRRIDQSYQRYLKNAIREQYPFEGCDIRFIVRKRTEKEARRGGVEAHY